MTRLAVVIVLATLSTPALATPFTDEAKQADVIFDGRLVGIGREPGFYSGEVMAIQTLTYEVVQVRKGTETRKLVPVRWILVGTLHLDARLTKLGTRYTVLEKDTPDLGLFALDAAP